MTEPQVSDIEQRVVGKTVQMWRDGTFLGSYPLGSEKGRMHHPTAKHLIPPKEHDDECARRSLGPAIPSRSHLIGAPSGYQGRPAVSSASTPVPVAAGQTTVPPKVAGSDRTDRDHPRKTTYERPVHMSDLNLPNVKSDTLAMFVVKVTPEIAMEWLTGSEHIGPNRTLSKRRIATFAAAMRRNEWKMTGEAIKFDKNGVLSDGQHRLHAVIEAEMSMPVEMAVVVGLEPKAQDYMDQGAARTAGDVLSIHNVGHANAVAAGARILYAYENGTLSPGSNPKIANDLILTWVLDHPDFPELVKSAMTIIRRVPCPQSVYLAAIYLMSRTDREGAIQFTTSFSSGTNLESGSPIYTLRERFNEMRAQRETHPSYVLLSAILRTFKSWRRGEVVRKIVLYRDGVSVQMPTSL